MPANGWWANYDIDLGNIDTIIPLPTFLSRNLLGFVS